MDRTTVPADDAPEQADRKAAQRAARTKARPTLSRVRFPVTTRIPITWSPIVRPLIHHAAVR